MVLGWVNAMKQIIDSGGNVSLDEAAHDHLPAAADVGPRGSAQSRTVLGRQLVERIPQGRLVMFDCGHPVHREQTDAFRRAVWEHLQAAKA